MIQGKTMVESEGRVGVMATVIEGGPLRLGDAVRVLETVP
jgi:MOSC domain-containing protein YiiM